MMELRLPDSILRGDSQPSSFGSPNVAHGSCKFEERVPVLPATANVPTYVCHESPSRHERAWQGFFRDARVGSRLALDMDLSAATSRAKIIVQRQASSRAPG